MENKKYFLKSKRFWGIVVSLVGFITIVIGNFFGKDLAPYVQTIGGVIQAFGLPFTFYGAVVADKPLGFKK